MNSFNPQYNSTPQTPQGFPPPAAQGFPPQHPTLRGFPPQQPQGFPPPAAPQGWPQQQGYPQQGYPQQGYPQQQPAYMPPYAPAPAPSAPSAPSAPVAPVAPSAPSYPSPPSMPSMPVTAAGMFDPVTGQPLPYDPATGMALSAPAPLDTGAGVAPEDLKPLTPF
ncbi:MAG: hypothetical protein LBR07_10325, partial [Puniceicoccales bacterium]|nr:hypothetical protein [Puniceicoccales bacterium]